MYALTSMFQAKEKATSLHESSTKLQGSKNINMFQGDKNINMFYQFTSIYAHTACTRRVFFKGLNDMRCAVFICCCKS